MYRSFENGYGDSTSIKSNLRAVERYAYCWGFTQSDYLYSLLKSLTSVSLFTVSTVLQWWHHTNHTMFVYNLVVKDMSGGEKEVCTNTHITVHYARTVQVTCHT